MNKKMLNLLTAYSAFTGPCMNSVYHPSNSIKFEKTRIKGLSSKEMGTANSRKKEKQKRKKARKKKMKIEEIKQAISNLYDKSNKCSNLLNTPHNNYKHIAMSISESVTDGLKDLMDKLDTY